MISVEIEERLLYSFSSDSAPDFENSTTVKIHRFGPNFLMDLIVWKKSALLFNGLLALLILTAPVVGHTETAKVNHQVSQEQLNISLEFPKAVPFQARVDGRELQKEIASQGGRELLLKFDRGVEAPGMEKLAESVSQWIEYTSSGFDTLLIHAQGLAVFKVSGAGNQVHIEVRRPSAEAEKKEQAPATKDLLHLESALNLQTHKFDSHARQTELFRAHPDDSQIIFDMAVAEERLGRWRRAIEHYTRASEMEPASIGKRQAKSYLHALYGPHVRFDQFFRDTSSQEIQWISQVHAREFVSRDYIVGLDYEYRHIDDNAVITRSNGTFDRFEGNREQWDFYVERGHGFAATRLTALGQENTPGAALEHRRQLYFGEILLRAVYREPYWAFVETLADEGTADRFQVQWNYEGHSHFGGGFQGASPLVGGIQTSINRYGLDSDPHVAESFELQLFLRYRFLDRVPGLSLGYGYDGEYVNQVVTRLDTNGNQFNPIPLISTEVHAFDVSMSKDLSYHLHYDATVGFSFDPRIESSGPFVYFSLIYDTLKNLQMGINVEFNQETARGTDNTFLQIGGFLLWRL